MHDPQPRRFGFEPCWDASKDNQGVTAVTQTVYSLLSLGQRITVGKESGVRVMDGGEEQN